MAVHQLNDLGSPHRFTLTRTHMVLFGEEDFEVVPPHTPTKIAVDMSAWVPGAEFRWVNTSPWRLGSMVVNTAEGPRWAHSESERTSITSDGTRWNIIKHQAALRLSLANTGRGLAVTGDGANNGNSSPFGFGTPRATRDARQVLASRRRARAAIHCVASCDGCFCGVARRAMGVARRAIGAARRATGWRDTRRVSGVPHRSCRGDRGSFGDSSLSLPRSWTA